MATIQAVNPNVSESEGVNDTVTRTINVQSDASANLHLLVKLSSEAAPTASQVVAGGLVATSTATNDFAVPDLQDATNYTAYAVADTPPTGTLAANSVVADGSAFNGWVYGYDNDRLGLDVDLNADGTVAVVTMTHADANGQSEAGEVRVLEQTNAPPDQFGKMTWQQRGSDIPIGTTTEQQEGRRVQINAAGDEILVAVATSGTIKRMKWVDSNWIELFGGSVSGHTIHQISASDDLRVLGVSSTVGPYRVLYWDGNAYVLMTNGEQNASYTTHNQKPIAVSGDGNTVAITTSSIVHTYTISNNTLTHDTSVDQISASGNTGGNFGTSLALSTDGLSIVIGTLHSRQVDRWTRTGPTAAWTNTAFPAGTTATAFSTNPRVIGYHNMLAVSGDGNRMAHIDQSGGGVGGFKLVDFSIGSETFGVTGGFGSSHLSYHFNNVNSFKRPSIAMSRDGSRVIVGSPGYNGDHGYAVVYGIDDGSTTSAVTSQSFATSDFTDPVVTVTPGTVGMAQADVTVTSTEAGTAYFLVQPSGNAAPTDAAQVKASALPSAAITAAGITHTLTGLTDGIEQTVYIVVEDSAVDFNGDPKPNPSIIQSTTFTTAVDPLAAIVDVGVRGAVRDAIATAGTAQARFSAAATALVGGTDPTGWTQLKATSRQVLDAVATQTADVAKDDVLALVAMPTLRPDITTVRMGRTLVELTEAQAATTASMLLLEGDGSNAVVKLTTSGGNALYWKVTKSGSATYAVETSTDGASYTASSSGHGVGESITAVNGGYTCTIVFNDPLATIEPPSAGSTADPYILARFH